MGMHKTIKTPQELYSLFKDYKQWAKNNPWEMEDYVGKDGNKIIRHKTIPLTWIGFELYLKEKEIIGTLQDYEFNREGRYEDFVTIIRAIKNEIYNQKYIGAAVGAFQQNIIARDLGLVEKQQQEIKKEIKVKVSDEEEIPEEIKKQYED